MVSSADSGSDPRFSTHKEPVPLAVMLRELRLAAGLTQAALAQRCGISARCVQHLELGLGQPRRDTTHRLADALGLAGEQHARFEAAAAPRPRRHATALQLAMSPPTPQLTPVGSTRRGPEADG